MGERAHAGSTPMDVRADAVVATAGLVVALERSAKAKGGFATVGVLDLEHSSSNVVPGRASFTIDLRHPSTAVLDQIENEIRAHTKAAMTTNPKLSFEIEQVWESPSVRFDDTAVECVRAAASSIVGKERVMALDSFAGHDSALTATKIPTAMIFVPSRGGISHSPEEYTSAEQW